MCELFALSSKFATKVTFSLAEFASHGGQHGHHYDGWGLAFYEQQYAQVFREVEPAAYSDWMQFLQNHQHRSTCVISHIRRATQGMVALRNTQPFSREITGQRHVFCHNGDLKNVQETQILDRFAPIGETDSEYAFCLLMERIERLWSHGRPPLARRATVVKEVFDGFAELGPANFIYADGDYLYAYANKRTQPNRSVEPPGMHFLCRSCEHDRDVEPITGVDIDSDQGAERQDVVLFASVPLSNENWTAFASRQLIICEAGKILSR